MANKILYAPRNRNFKSKRLKRVFWFGPLKGLEVGLASLKTSSRTQYLLSICPLDPCGISLFLGRVLLTVEKWMQQFQVLYPHTIQGKREGWFPESSLEELRYLITKASSQYPLVPLWTKLGHTPILNQFLKPGKCCVLINHVAKKTESS